MASPIVRGQNFGSTELVTATKLQNIVDSASFKDFDGSTEVFTVSGDDLGTCVKAGGLRVNTSTGQLSLKEQANLTALGNTSGSEAVPTAVSILDEDTMSSNSATSLATQQSIKAFAGMTPVQNGSGGGYSGGESLTFPNGLTMKFGRVAATTNGDYTVNFAENFNTAVISAMAITNVSTSETINAQIVGTPGVGSMVVGIQNEDHLTGFYWQAIGH